MATNKSRKRATRFLPKDEVDWARAQREAKENTPDTRTFDQRRAQDKARTGRLQQRIQASSGNTPAFKPTPAPAHATPKVSHTGRNLAIAGGVTAGVAGTGYLVHRHNQKQKELASKMLVDPFAKAYPIVEPVPRSIRVAALLPTGRHVGNANDLKHYRITPKGHRQGPFSKGIFGGGRRVAASAQRAGALRGLEMTKPGYTKDWDKVTMPLRRQGGGASIRRRPELSATSPMASADHKARLEFRKKPVFPPGSLPVHGDGSKNWKMPQEGRTGRKLA